MGKIVIINTTFISFYKLKVHIYNLSMTINVLVYHDRFMILYQLTKWNHSPFKKDAKELLMSAE